MYRELFSRFWPPSLNNGHVCKLVTACAMNTCHANTIVLTGRPFVDLSNCERRIAQLKAEYRNLYSHNHYSVYQLRKMKSRGIVVNHYDERISYLTEIEDLQATINLLKRRVELSVPTESGEVSDGAISNSVMKEEETLMDVLGEDEKGISAGKMTRGPVLKTIKSLDDFFERPVEIAAQQVTPGIAQSFSYKVWDLYTLDPSVRAKLRNYSYLKANLHLRIAFSGTPFHYGRFLASYQPCAERNENIISHGFADAATSTWRPLFINYLSQAIGAVTINVNENKPVHMECPFISTKNMHRLFGTGSTAISDVTSFPDLQNAGTLFLYSINDVGSVSATPTNVYFRIYAWMTDVELGVPTATNLAVTTESGEMDEREVGPVQRFASYAESISSALTVVPIFEPFASASSQIFSGIGSIASYFGWSVPVMLHEPSLVRNRAVFNGSQTIGYSSAKRVTYDPKQEITVDPYATGIDDDQLTIQALCSRRSYLRTFTWNPGSSTILWKCRVSPNLATTTQTGITPLNYFQPTAMAFAAQPFYFWRGDITFRFEFVTSNYHRGKVAIVYEPNISQEPLISSDYHTNKQYVRIVDLQETQVVDFCVEWASPRSWLKCLPRQSLTLNDTDFSASNSAFGFVNGFIYVYPFNELQSPDGDGIDINVYVHSDNMNFNQHRNDFPLDRRVPTESGEVSSDVTQDVTCIELNPTGATTENICHEHFGERIFSFRTLLKRYSGTKVFTSSVPAGLTRVVFVKDNYPPPNSDYTSTGTVELSTLFGYLRLAYLGIRGSVRYRVEVVSDYNLRRTQMFYIGNDIASDSVVEGTFTSPNLFGYNPLGTVAIPAQTSPILDYEIPYYSNNKFCFSFAPDLVGSNPEEDMEETWSRTHDIYFTDDHSTTATMTFVYSVSTGEDFNFMRYCGAPFYRESPIV